MGGWGEGGSLPAADARILRVLFEHPEWSADRIAKAAAISPSTAAKARARLRAQGLWAPWYDVDLRAAGAGPFLVVMGRCYGGKAAEFAQAAIPRILADHKVAGIFIAEGDQVYGITIPRSLEDAANLEAALLEALDPSTNGPWLFNAKIAPIAADGAPAVDYRAFPDLITRPTRARPGRPPSAAKPSGRASSTPLTAREVRVLSFVVRNSAASLSAGARATGLAPRTFARAKARLLAQNVIWPSARMHLTRAGFSHLLVTLLRHRPGATRARRLRAVSGALEGGAMMAAFSSPARTMIMAAFRSQADAEAAQHRIAGGVAGLEWLEPPVSFVFSYAGLRRAGFTLEGDAGSAWLQAAAESPSVGRLHAGRPRGSLRDAHPVRQKAISGLAMERA